MDKLTCGSIDMCMRLQACIYIYIYMNVYVYIYIYLCVYVRVYVCLCSLRDLGSGLSETCVDTRKEVSYA